MTTTAVVGVVDTDGRLLCAACYGAEEADRDVFDYGAVAEVTAAAVPDTGRRYPVQVSQPCDDCGERVEGVGWGRAEAIREAIR